MIFKYNQTLTPALERGTLATTQTVQQHHKRKIFSTSNLHGDAEPISPHLAQGQSDKVQQTASEATEQNGNLVAQNGDLLARILVDHHCTYSRDENPHQHDGQQHQLNWGCQDGGKADHFGHQDHWWQNYQA